MGLDCGGINQYDINSVDIIYISYTQTNVLESKAWRSLYELLGQQGKLLISVHPADVGDAGICLRAVGLHGQGFASDCAFFPPLNPLAPASCLLVVPYWALAASHSKRYYFGGFSTKKQMHK